MTLVIHLKKIFLALIVAGLWLLASAPPALASHFSMRAAPSSGSVDQGNTIHFVATATYVSAPAETIGFNVLGLPPGATASYSTLECAPTCSTIVTVNAGAAAAGTYAVTVQGVGSIDIADPPSAEYSLTITDPLAGATTNKSFTDDGTFSTTGSATGGGFGNGTNSQTAVSGSGTGADIRLSFQPKSDAELSESATIALGSAPYAIAFDSFTNSIWVAQGWGGVSKINLSTNAVTAVSGVGFSQGVAFDSFTNSIWVTSHVESRLYKINPVTAAVISLSMPGPRAIAFDSFTNSVWVGNDDNTVKKINPVTNLVTATVPLGSAPYAIAFDSFTNSIWVAQSGVVSNVNKIDLSTNTVTATIPGLYPYAIAFDSFTNSIWVASSSRGYKIDPVAAAVTTTINDASSYSPIAFDSFTNSIWVAQEFVGAKKINPVTAVAAATVPLSSYIQPFSSPVAFDSFTKSIWVGIGSPAAIIKINLAKPYYASSGVFTSAAINLGAPSSFTTVNWNETLPSGTNVQIQMRSASTEGGLSSAVWYGPTGTSNYYETTPAGENINSVHNGSRWIQYRATLTTPSPYTTTPALNDITINYQNSFDFNFSVAIVPQDGTVMQGGSLNVSPGITAALTYGTATPNPVTFSVDPANLPRGVSVEFINPSPPSPCTPASSQPCASEITIRTNVTSCASTATLFCPTTLGTTDLGDFVIPIKASIVVDAQNTITKEATFQFTVAEPFNYNMAWTGASSGTVTQGGNFSAPFQAVRTGGATSESVLYSYTTSAQGVSVAFSYNSCLPDCSVTADIRTTFTGGAGDTPVGAHSITVIGTSAGGISRNITFNLTVNAAFNFSMALNNTSGGMFAGETASPLPTLTTTYVSGSTGTVSYAITINGQPLSSYPDIIVTPATLGNDVFTTLGQTYEHPFSIATSLAANPATYSIVITGTSGTGLVRYATYVLTVYPPFDFTMAFDPPTGNFNATASPQDFAEGTTYQGESLSTMLIVTYNSPFPQTVNFSHVILPASPDVSASYTASCSGTCIIPLFISANAPAEGNFTVTLTGTGGGQTHTARYTLSVLVPPVDYNMRGWAFSDGVGWISFNSRNCDTDWDGFMDRTNIGSGTGDIPSLPDNCPSDKQPDGSQTIIPNYGTHLDFSSYELSGWAWSEHIGWITFEKTVAGTPPTAPFNDATQAYIARLNNGIVEGWARAVSCSDAACDTDSEWGWIKMSGNY